MATRSKYVNSLMMFLIQESVLVTKGCSTVPFDLFISALRAREKTDPRIHHQVTKADKLGWQEIFDLLGFIFFLEFLVYFFSSLWKPPPRESIFSFETGFIKGEVQVPASYKRSHTLPLYIWEFKEVVTWVAGCQKKIISEINNIDCLFPSKT